MRKIKFIPEIKKAPQMWSVRVASATLLLQGAWNFVPADMRASMPTWTLQIATMVLIGAYIVVRLIRQDKLHEDVHADTNQDCSSST